MSFTNPVKQAFGGLEKNAEIAEVIIGELKLLDLVTTPLTVTCPEGGDTWFVDFYFNDRRGFRQGIVHGSFVPRIKEIFGEYLTDNGLTIAHGGPPQNADKYTTEANGQRCWISIKKGWSKKNKVEAKTKKDAEVTTKKGEVSEDPVAGLNPFPPKE